ncbi:hypothetical protein [Nonomuraea sp. NPDC049784]|uniref:hypothetical protein n=1 Tax=Nonomuraea sp. NPDC049784 TaxID=3154361 RepID=UPI0033C16481
MKLSIGLAYTTGSTTFAVTPGAASAVADVEIMDDKTVKIPRHEQSQREVRPPLLADFWDKQKTSRGTSAAAETAREDPSRWARRCLAFAPPEGRLRQPVHTGPGATPVTRCWLRTRTSTMPRRSRPRR